MADFSYQALMGALAQQQQPQSMWQGLGQSNDPAQQVPNGASPLPQMMAKQQMQQDPRAFMPTINPGRTWNGRDANNVHPYDVQVSRTNVLPPENI